MSITKRDYTFTISKTPDIMNENEYSIYIKELEKRKELIHDINISCNMQPFDMDAHGVLLTKDENDAHIKQMLRVQKETNINIAMVFNNIYIPNDFDTLKIFLNNFDKYYYMGVRNITLPHLLWLKTGEIKKIFPELYVKSTVLRKVRTGQEFWNYAESGFDCVNIDRLLFRNRDALKEIKLAQTKFYHMYNRYVEISMVVDENCLGNCSFLEEHYQHTMTSNLCKSITTNVEGFNIVPDFSGCRNIDNISLKRVNLICFHEDLQDILSYIDIVKFGGRRFKVDSFKLIDSINDDNLTCHPLLHKILVRDIKDEVELLNKWRKKTVNCGYQCWNCDLCNEMDINIFKGRVKEWRKSIWN